MSARNSALRRAAAGWTRNVDRRTGDGLIAGWHRACAHRRLPRRGRPRSRRRGAACAGRPGRAASRFSSASSIRACPWAETSVATSMRRAGSGDEGSGRDQGRAHRRSDRERQVGARHGAAREFGGVVVQCGLDAGLSRSAGADGEAGARGGSERPASAHGHVDGAVNYSAMRYAAEVAAADGAARQRQLPILRRRDGSLFQGLDGWFLGHARGAEGVRAASANVPRACDRGAACRTRRTRSGDGGPGCAPPTGCGSFGRSRCIWQRGVRSPRSRARENPGRWRASEDAAALRQPEAERRAGGDRQALRGDDATGGAGRGGAPEIARSRSAASGDAGHGVPGLIAHLDGVLSLEEAIRRGQADTRAYAKRQITWFRHQMEGWQAVAPDAALASRGGGSPARLRRRSRRLPPQRCGCGPRSWRDRAPDRRVRERPAFRPRAGGDAAAGRDREPQRLRNQAASACQRLLHPRGRRSASCWSPRIRIANSSPPKRPTRASLAPKRPRGEDRRRRG